MLTVAWVFEIEYYRTFEGKCPVEDYLDGLSDRQVEKVLWTLRVVRDLNPVPAQYLQKMSGTDDLWEVRISYTGNIFRLLGFVSDRRLVLTHGFTKKTQKTPPQEVATAAARKRDHETRKKRKN